MVVINMPGVVSSLILIIVGAVAKYAYSDSVWSWTSGGQHHSLRVDTVGMILMLAGLAALFLSIVWGFLSTTDSVVEEEEVVVKKADKAPVKAKKRTRRKSV
jgi:lysylphosphatidylglycerol synthetase-like protein (DUF2156 family)